MRVLRFLARFSLPKIVIPCPGLPHRPIGLKMAAMRRLIASRRVIASFCVCWLAYCGATRSNVLPLAFGMTPVEASLALGEPLVYHSGRRGSEVYVAGGPAGIPGFYPTDAGVALQFPNRPPTRWEKEWELPPPWPFLFPS